jgi:putative hydrolase of the HAD superfamily
MPPRLVIFDMDDVLCHYDLGRRLRALSRLSGARPRDIRAAIWDSGFEDSSDAGGYPDPGTYLAEFGRRLGYPISRAQWIAARRDSMIPCPDVLQLAKQIGETAGLALYTNNGPLVKHHLDELFPEAAAIFTARFCSYEFATKKPDPQSFRRLVERLGAAAEHCWFIDDQRSNVQGARLAGLRGHHFRGIAELAAEARTLGLTP